MEVEPKLSASGRRQIDKKAAVRNMAIIYFLNFTCIGGASVLVSYIYDQIGLVNLGQTNQFLIYLGFFISTFFARNLLSLFKEIRTCLFVGFLFYGFIILASIGTYACYSLKPDTDLCSVGILRFANYITNFNLGLLGATFVWSGQYEFIDRISLKEEKSEMFSIFFSLLQFNGIIANLINILFYSFEVNIPSTASWPFMQCSI